MKCQISIYTKNISLSGNKQIEEVQDTRTGAG